MAPRLRHLRSVDDRRDRRKPAVDAHRDRRRRRDRWRGRRTTLRGGRRRDAGRRGAHAERSRPTVSRSSSPTASSPCRVPVVTSVAEAGVDASTRRGARGEDAGHPAACSPSCGAARRRPRRWRASRTASRTSGSSARAFPNTYGVVVMMPAAHLEPGGSRPTPRRSPGLFDIGLAAGWRRRDRRPGSPTPGAAGFDARVVPDVMRWKYTKLLMNLGNAVEAICVRDGDAAELVQRARAEARDLLRRRRDRLRVGGGGGGAPGRPPPGPQIDGTPPRRRVVVAVDRARVGSIEADAFNGEVVRIGTGRRDPDAGQRRRSASGPTPRPPRGSHPTRCPPRSSWPSSTEPSRSSAGGERGDAVDTEPRDQEPALAVAGEPGGPVGEPAVADLHLVGAGRRSP